jgi:NAD+ synthase
MGADVLDDGRIKKAYFPKGTAHAIEELSDQVLDWTVGTGAKGGVIGLSGGIDSTTVAYLCKHAFDGYNRAVPTDRHLKLLGLILPSSANDPKDAADGLRVANLLGIESKVIPIQPMADAFKAALPDALENRFDVGNLYSELRAVVLSRYGGAYNLRVMGTGNRDEDYVLGYCTKRGDGAVDNNILGNLPKRLVRDLAAALGTPQDLVTRVPTAGLWKGQTDQGELGYSYDYAEIIQNGYDEGKSVDAIVRITGYDRWIVEDVQKRHIGTEHKRQLPPVGDVTLAYR